MGLLFSNYYVGLDVGRYKVEGVKLRKKGKEVEVVSSFSVPYENKAFDGENIVDESEIAIALGKTKMALKIDIEDHITTALFPDRILFRKLELPTMVKEQAMNAAKFQIVKELSISSEEIAVEIEAKQKDISSLDVSSFIVKVEDVSKFNSLLFKAGIPFPDILDAGYFKFNYIMKEEFFKGILIIAFEDISSTYVEIFKDNWLVGIDSVTGGSEGLEKLDEISILSHYADLNDRIQNLVRMMFSRYSMADMVADHFIFISELRKNNDFWAKAINNFEVAKEIVPYEEAVTVDKNLPLAAYSLAMRGVNENSKGKLLQKKGSKGKTV
ncbi:hypothetical protein [Mesoaciditoga lauensis]|uniref:hypothetical protein n=1 Tax=Mesoaciditoga lauensis TaxID=1495039 RepID=UPI00055D989B|nr:hypothetical protein [Mesoaciditoga lauensis]